MATLSSTLHLASNLAKVPQESTTILNAFLFKGTRLDCQFEILQTRFYSLSQRIFIDNYFFQETFSLIIHKEKTKEIATVTVVWIPALD